MDVSSSTSAQTSSTSTATSSKSNDAAGKNAATNSLNGDFETFLRLLTTQLQNQDPLDPTNSTEFVAQLANFSSVEQQVQTNTKLELDDHCTFVVQCDPRGRLHRQAGRSAGQRHL